MQPTSSSISNFHLTSVTQEPRHPVLKILRIFVACRRDARCFHMLREQRPSADRQPTTLITNQRPPQAWEGGNVGKALHEIRSLGKRACPPYTDWINRVIITGVLVPYFVFGRMSCCDYHFSSLKGDADVTINVTKPGSWGVVLGLICNFYPV